MELNDNIFRANDIRGIAFEDLTEDVVFSLGRALGTETINRSNNEFIIGRDGRVSSPKLFEWLSEGVISTGCNVIDIGVVPSPVFYHSTFYLSCSSGVIITGSHNPKNYNGFKMMIKNEPFFGKDIQKLGIKAKSGSFINMNGSIESLDLDEKYLEKI